MTFPGRILSILLIFFISPALYAGDIKKINGEAEYFAPYTVAPAVALENAIKEARINAMSEAFGTAVSERTLVVSDTYDGHTHTTHHSYGECEVNGDWIRDLKEPEVTKREEANGTVYFVKVYGEAREKKYNKIDVDCRLLCNGIDPERDRLRGNAYYEGDEMYVYFVSPVDGWLAIYLTDDDEARTTQCLVPYDGQKDAAYPIEANKEYLFFSKRTAEPQYASYVTRMECYARKKTDLNDLCVIFSPNKFSQTTTTAYRQSNHSDDEPIAEELMPRETTHSKFDKWLVRQRRSDADLQLIPFSISINKHK